ncbi:chemotaxis protein CheB, partial [Pseudomonas sp.]|uniref:chemotaxis protein CheB n=1 Tax=Pseudomonas sp. TaxID=306 RepID=UPI0033904F8E
MNAPRCLPWPSRCRARRVLDSACSLAQGIAMSADSPHHPAVDDPELRSLSFPVVGIGSSAGGLQAVKQFFKHMPSDSGMAFV